MRAQSTGNHFETKIRRLEEALDNLTHHEEECKLCPRECGVNRAKGEMGFCKSGSQASISHALRHYGEEPVLSGTEDFQGERAPERFYGSGTVFFSGCHLKCLFCQNYQLSWENLGKPKSAEALAYRILSLQADGALNINLVSPTHFILPILKALRIAILKGFRLPIVYNSNGYEKADILRYLEGIVDIYLPDIKFLANDLAKHLSGVSDYFAHAQSAVKEMYMQKPVLVLDKEGAAKEGLIIRHLVLPGQNRDSLDILDWIAQNLSNSVCLSLMSQYQPCFNAPQEFQKTLSVQEYFRVLDRARNLGFQSIYFQSAPSSIEKSLTPDFSRKNPFHWKG
jgi:putative pyruvate formate lyase activating enzyme